MDNFVVSARKYRPATFNTVVGQSSITTTLKNAIKNNHLAQAFLFCGPRGVGKTTCARILAKTINCSNLTPDTEACDQCESCRSFNSGQSFNVYELDAASNNSVDDIRNLVDQVRIPPQMGQYKVYIIDEVHMLSAAAFNAFLKTLEEPPRYAIFILATTERHKILPTILSRCQIFNFNRIQVDDIAGHLAYIAQQENVTAEPDALHVIAQKADGALRDACSIFDQVVSFTGNNITYKGVIQNLNVLDYDYYFKVTDHILSDEIPGALLLYNEVLGNGFDGHNFIAGLADHFRNLLVCKDPQTLVLLEAGQNIREKYRDQSSRCQQMFLLRGLKLINKCDIGYKSARNPRLQVEFTLMQLCALNGTQSVEKKNDELNGSDAPTPGSQGFSRKNGNTTQSAQSSDPNTPSNSVTPAAKTEQQTAQPVAATNQSANTVPIQKKNIVRSTASLSGFINGNTQKKVEQEPEKIVVPGSVNATPFTQDQLEKCWTEFANDLKEKGRNTDYSALTMNKPVLVGEQSVTFTVFNKMVEERLISDKTSLMSFLREKLRNNVFTLEIILSKEEGEQKIYGSQDKFKFLAEKNPALQKLRQQFDLDIEY